MSFISVPCVVSKAAITKEDALFTELDRVIQDLRDIRAKEINSIFVCSDGDCTPLPRELAWIQS